VSIILKRAEVLKAVNVQIMAMQSGREIPWFQRIWHHILDRYLLLPCWLGLFFEGYMFL
jgi:hypothetical protein